MHWELAPAFTTADRDMATSAPMGLKDAPVAGKQSLELLCIHEYILLHTSVEVYISVERPPRINGTRGSESQTPYFATEALKRLANGDRPMWRGPTMSAKQRSLGCNCNVLLARPRNRPHRRDDVRIGVCQTEPADSLTARQPGESFSGAAYTRG
jgi:hypothetical protein